MRHTVKCHKTTNVYDNYTKGHKMFTARPFGKSQTKEKWPMLARLTFIVLGASGIWAIMMLLVWGVIALL